MSPILLLRTNGFINKIYHNQSWRSDKITQIVDIKMYGRWPPGFRAEVLMKFPPCCRRAACSWTPESASRPPRTTWAPAGPCGLSRRPGPPTEAHGGGPGPRAGPGPGPVPRGAEVRDHRTTWSTELCGTQPSQPGTNPCWGFIQWKQVQVCSSDVIEDVISSVICGHCWKATYYCFVAVLTCFGYLLSSFPFHNKIIKTPQRETS